MASLEDFDEIKKDPRELYYQRLHLLVVKHATFVLRCKFDQFIPPNQLHSALNNQENMKRIRYASKNKVLSSRQLARLHPTSGPPKSKDFDISLLMYLLKYMCGLDTKSAWWKKEDNSKIPRNNNEVVADIVRIRNLRNKLHHTPTASLEKNEFETEWNLAEEVLVRLTEQCGIVGFKQKIDNVKHNNQDDDDDYYNNQDDDDDYYNNQDDDDDYYNNQDDDDDYYNNQDDDDDYYNNQDDDDDYFNNQDDDDDDYNNQDDDDDYYNNQDDDDDYYNNQDDDDDYYNNQDDDDDYYNNQDDDDDYYNNQDDDDDYFNPVKLNSYFNNYLDKNDQHHVVPNDDHNQDYDDYDKYDLTYLLDPFHSLRCIRLPQLNPAYICIGLLSPYFQCCYNYLHLCISYSSPSA